MGDKPAHSTINLSYKYTETDKDFKVLIKIHSYSEWRGFRDIVLKFEHSGHLFTDGQHIEFIKHGNSVYTLLLNSESIDWEDFNDEITISGKLPFSPFKLDLTAQDSYYGGYTICETIMIKK